MAKCGDNCTYWFLRIGAMKDVTINPCRLMDFGNGRFPFKVDNTGQIVHPMDELVLVAGDCLQEGYK